MAPVLVMSVGAILILVLLIQAWRPRSESARLKLRLASIAPATDLVLPGEASETQSLERMFLCAGEEREEVVVALRGAGYYTPYSVVIFAAARLFGTLGAGAGAYFLLRSPQHPGTTIFYSIAAAAGIFLLSKMILRSRVAAHTRQVGKELPFLLDTLLLLLESGVSLDQAFRYFAQTPMGGMAFTREAVTSMVNDLQRGVPYALALDRWADRLAVPGVRELAALFKQTLLSGSEIGPALRSFTKEFSEKRLSASRESIGRKTTQLTMVMILFMMPALMIVLAGPAVVSVQSAMKSLGEAK